MFDPSEMDVSNVDGWFVFTPDDGGGGAVYLPLHSAACLSLVPSEGNFCIVEGPDDNGASNELQGKVKSVSRSYRYKPKTGRFFCEIRVELGT